MRLKGRRNRLPIALLGFVLVCSCAILSAQNEPQKPKQTGFGDVFRVAGVLVSKTTGAPLARARVTLVETENPHNAQSMVSAEDGRFEFNRLRAGKYSLRGSRHGFVPTAYEQHEQFSTAIVTGPTLKTEDLILRLVPAAMISGRILDESGEPVHHATVRLYRENRDLGFRRITPSASPDSSDDRGYYDFWPLLPGTYYVAAAATPWYAVHPPSSHSDGTETPLQVDPSLDVSYPTTFYADTTEADAATPVLLKGGDQVEIDIHLAPAPSLHLLFHVPENGQNGVPSPILQKRVFDSVEYARNEGVEPVSDGTYELIGVPAGRYTVRLRGSTPGEPDQATEMNLTRDGLELDSSPGEPLGSLTLSMKIAGEEKLSEPLFVALRDAHLRNLAVQAVDPSGEAHFEGLPAGRYAILAGSPGKAYFVSQTSSLGSDPSPVTSGNSFELAAGSSLSLSALLIGGTTRVEGFVKRSGKPAAGVMVVLIPGDAGAGLELFRRDQSDLDGSFVMRGVVPGSYTVIAVEDGWDLDWSVPAVLARFTPRGQRLTIGPQGQASVSLPEPVEAQPR